jgi:hypothetical protein
LAARSVSTRVRVVATAAAVVIIGSVAVVGASAIGRQNPASVHWGVIPRNIIGSPVAELRSGPYGSFGVTGQAGRPPLGKGSLGIYVNNVPGFVEKVDFGNEVDFYGDPVLALNQVGFHVFQTQENVDAGGLENMPNIRFEIDPNTVGDINDYTTMVWVPDAAPVVNRWSAYIDATSSGYWYFTGADHPGTVCNQATECTFAEAKAALNDGGQAPIFYTVAVGKGRDFTWGGAVDGLRINSRVFDFEANGVRVRGGGGGD